MGAVHYFVQNQEGTRSMPAIQSSLAASGSDITANYAARFFMRRRSPLVAIEFLFARCLRAAAFKRLCAFVASTSFDGVRQVLPFDEKIWLLPDGLNQDALIAAARWRGDWFDVGLPRVPMRTRQRESDADPHMPPRRSFRFDRCLPPIGGTSPIDTATSRLRI
jgi:hypothetical protein